MPAMGQIGGAQPPGATVELREFTEAMREVYRSFGPASMEVISGRIGVSEASLSHYLNGRRFPTDETLRVMYSLAVEGWKRQGLPPAYALDDLCRLRHLARCGRCRCAPARGGDGVLPGQQDRRNSKRTGGREEGRRGGPVALAADWDRRNSEPRHLVGAAAFMAAVTGSAGGERLTILWAMGGEMSPPEAGAALRALAGSGLGEECEVLLESLESHGKDIKSICREILTERALT
ncbi:helix-turn-helix domain-containing protein [Streptomyces uncialis]|uniref:helix-turn-helix domain-containing protein n=1 Tax=Streptomyces uncialis TaxID=1048205 RepID=UPI003824A1F5